MSEITRDKIKKLYRDAYQFYGDIKRKGIHIRAAKNNVSGKLPKEYEKKAKKFFEPYTSINPVFHQFYTEKTGKFYENYVPDDFYYQKIDTYYNDWMAAIYMGNKCLFPLIFSGRGVRLPEIFSMRINNMWYDGQYNLISKDEISKALKNQRALFIKVAVQSGGGHGVTYIENNGDDFEKRFWETVNGINVDVVIQTPLKQHEALSKLNESSVNTVRVISMLSQDGVKIYSSILRMGINGSKVDNASSGGITCGIDRNTGRLKNVAYTQNGKKFDRHPTSNVKFETITIPSYAEIEATVKRLHLILPHFRLVSWDIAVGEDANPILIEANLKYGELDFHQLNNGPLFGDDTQKILKEVTGK